MSKKKKDSQKKIARKVAKIIGATAVLSPFALGMPATIGAVVSPPVPVPSIPGIITPIQTVLSNQVAGNLQVGDTIELDLSAVFENALDLVYSVTVQNKSVANVIVENGRLKITMKKQGTTNVTVGAQKQDGSWIVDRVRLTADNPAALDPNQDGKVRIDEIIKYMNLNPYKTAEGYKSLISTVKPGIPVANHGPITTHEVATILLHRNSPITVNLDEYFSDEDGDLLTYSIPYIPSSGLGVSLNGNILQLVEYGMSGSLDLMILANDGSSAPNSIATQVLHVTVAEAVPVATADHYSVTKDSTLERNAAKGVLKNDQYFSGNSLSAEKVSDPTHGTLNSFNADGSFQYTPQPGYTGPDTFTYRVSNANQTYSEPVTVTINVKINTNPAVDPANKGGVNNNGIFNLRNLQGLAINLDEVFTDADGDDLTYEIVYNSGAYNFSAYIEPDGDKLYLSHYSSGSSMAAFQVKAKDDDGATVTHDITANAVSGAISSANTSANPNHWTTLSLENYFDLPANGAWSINPIVINPQVATTDLQQQTKLTLQGRTTGSTDLIILVKDGHGGVISNFVEVNSGISVTDIGTFYLGEYYDTFSSGLDLSEVFKGADSYRILSIEGELEIEGAVVGEWFTYPHLGLSKDQVGAGSVIFEANSISGETALYELTVRTNQAPIFAGVDQPILIKNDTTFNLDLNKVFTDPDGDSLDFDVWNSEGSLVELGEVTGGILPITASEAGFTSVSISAWDGKNGGYSEHMYLSIQAVDELVTFSAGSRTASLDISHLNLGTGSINASFESGYPEIIQSITATNTALNFTAFEDTVGGWEVLNVTISDGTKTETMEIHINIPSDRQVYTKEVSTDLNVSSFLTGMSGTVTAAVYNDPVELVKSVSLSGGVLTLHAFTAYNGDVPRSGQGRVAIMFTDESLATRKMIIDVHIPAIPL